MSRTALRICPLCEATCGLTLTIEGTEVTRARGDRDDVFSKGFICPKGAAFGAVDGDPDRLRTPLVRKDGEATRSMHNDRRDTSPLTGQELLGRSFVAKYTRLFDY